MGLVYQYLLVEELSRLNVTIIFLNNQITDSPESNLLLQVQGIIAEYERTKILERSRRGKMHAAKSGKCSVLGGAPYGYRYIPKNNNDIASYEIVEKEAEIKAKEAAEKAEKEAEDRKAKGLPPLTEEEKIAMLQQKSKTDKPKKGKEASLDGAAAAKPPKA